MILSLASDQSHYVSLRQRDTLRRRGVSGEEPECLNPPEFQHDKLKLEPELEHAVT